MFTTLNCIPCFFRQLLGAARIAAPGDETLHQKVILGWAARLAREDLSDSPPAVAGRMYAFAAEITGATDIFARDKAEANARALELLPRLRGLRDAEGDPLKRALEISIIGNYMDSGVALDGDWEREVADLSEALDPAVFASFEAGIVPGADVLIIGDNAGEICLDLLLVEELQRRGAHVTYAVRGRPILNDATLDDARSVGMADLCEILSSGADTPGTVLKRCTPEFIARMDRADLVLSKGQGNFEALCHVRPRFFFAFKVKCPVVAEMTARPVGHSMLCNGPEPNA